MENFGQSALNPLALLLLAAASCTTLFGSKQLAVKSLLAMAAFLPLGQQIVALGLHFHFFRILILVGWVRVFWRGEFRGFRWGTIDKIFLAWALVTLVCGVLRAPSAEVFGRAYNSLGTYFLIRILVRTVEDVQGQIRFLALAATVIGAAMLLEWVTQRNPFAVFGGVQDVVGERSGRLRCQGPFRHPILAGTFAATLFPVLVGLWYEQAQARRKLVLGILACLFCTLVSASSGAVLTCGAAMLGLALWPFRTRMREFRWAVVLGILALALVMNAPVYYLIARISNVMGGTGWHRSFLIDQALTHLGEWWLIGSSYTAHWAPGGQVLLVDPNNMDITNHYIALGLQGGLLGLGLFVALLAGCFRILGRALAGTGGPPARARFIWGLGVGLAAHSTAFFSISYFDQSVVFLFWLFGVIACVPGWVGAGEPARSWSEPEAIPGATAWRLS